MRILRAFAALSVMLLASCYQSHERGERDDAAVPPPGDLPEGVLFDNVGRFREVILTDAPLGCESVRYRALDTTGSVEAPVPRWMSLSIWSGGGPSYFMHTSTTNIGPGPATMTIPDSHAPGRVAIGARVPVTWSANVLTIGRLGGTSTVTYCGMVSPR